MMTQVGVPVVRGKRGRGLRSRAAKAAKRATSTAARDRRGVRPSYHGVARRLVQEGLASPDIVDGYRATTPRRGDGPGRPDSPPPRPSPYPCAGTSDLKRMTPPKETTAP